MKDDDPFHGWRKPVGEMILSFGNLELALLRLYELKLPNRNYFNDSFEMRFDKLIGKFRTEEQPANIVDAMIELKKLSEIRHLVAHSALYIDIFVHERTGEVVTESAISDTRDRSNRVTLPDLRQLSEKASELVQILHEHFMSEFWASEGE